MQSINEKFRLASILRILPGQKRFISLTGADSIVTIVNSRLDDEIRYFATNPMANELVVEDIPPEMRVISTPQAVSDTTESEDFSSIETLALEEPVGNVSIVDSSTVKVRTSLKTKGIGWKSALAVVLAILSSITISIFVFTSNWFTNLAFRRHGRRGGGTCRFLADSAHFVRGWLRMRGAEVVDRVYKKQNLNISRKKFKNYLYHYNFEKVSWIDAEFMSDDTKEIVAEQNSFIQAVSSIDDGDKELAVISLERVQEILRKYDIKRVKFLDVLTGKVSYLASERIADISTEVGENSVVTEVFKPTDHGLIDVNKCSMVDIMKLDLTTIDVTTTVNQVAARKYVDLLRCLQCLFAVVGTANFISAYMVFKGQQYPSLQEAFNKDVEMRKEKLAKATTEEEKKFDWFNLVIVLSFSLGLGISAVKGGKGLWDFYQSKFSRSAKFLQQAEEVSGSIAEKALQRRLQALKEGADGLVGGTPGDDDDSGDEAAPEQDSRDSIVQELLRDVDVERSRREDLEAELLRTKEIEESRRQTLELEISRAREAERLRTEALETEITQYRLPLAAESIYGESLGDITDRLGRLVDRVGNEIIINDNLPVRQSVEDIVRNQISIDDAEIQIVDRPPLMEAVTLGGILPTLEVLPIIAADHHYKMENSKSDVVTPFKGIASSSQLDAYRVDYNEDSDTSKALGAGGDVVKINTENNPQSLVQTSAKKVLPSSVESDIGHFAVDEMIPSDQLHEDTEDSRSVTTIKNKGILPMAAAVLTAASSIKGKSLKKSKTPAPTKISLPDLQPSRPSNKYSVAFM